jgi:hypothetical protein
MELKLVVDTTKSIYPKDLCKDCYIEVFFNNKKLAHISFLMFCGPDIMLEELPLIINGDHSIIVDGQDQKISSSGDSITFEFDDSNSSLTITLPKNLCIPIFQDMIKYYSQ